MMSQAYYESESDCAGQSEADVDVFLLVYSVTDRQSFGYVQQCLQDVAKVRRRRAGLVVVANKYDLVRNRVVSTAGWLIFRLIQACNQPSDDGGRFSQIVDPFPRSPSLPFPFLPLAVTSPLKSS